MLPDPYILYIGCRTVAIPFDRAIALWMIDLAGRESKVCGRMKQGYCIWKYRGFHLGSLVMASGIFGFNPLDIR